MVSEPTDDDIRETDSYGMVPHGLAFGADDDITEASNEHEYPETTWTDIDSEKVAEFITDNGNDVVLVELLDDGDITVPLVHYYNTDVEGMRMFDPRIENDLKNPTEGWLEHSLSHDNGNHFCLVGRRAAFSYIGHDDPNDDDMMAYDPNTVGLKETERETAVGSLNGEEHERSSMGDDCPRCGDSYYHSTERVSGFRVRNIASDRTVCFEPNDDGTLSAYFHKD